MFVVGAVQDNVACAEYASRGSQMSSVTITPRSKPQNKEYDTAADLLFEFIVSIFLSCAP